MKKKIFIKKSSPNICIYKYNPNNCFKLNRKIFFKNKKFIFLEQFQNKQIFY